MTTLSTQATVAAERRWSEPFYLFQLDLPSFTYAGVVYPALTLRYSDVARVVLGFEWQPLIQDWGSIAEAMNTTDVGGRPATVEVSFFNNKAVEGRARLSALLLKSPTNPTAYESTYAKSTIFQVFKGGVAGDEIRLGVFYIEEPTRISQERLAFSMSDRSQAIERRPRLTLIDRATFRDAATSALGKYTPLVFGTVPALPLLLVHGGASSRLAAPLGFGQAGTAVQVVDSEGFPETGLYLIQVGAEVIECDGRTSEGFPNVNKRSRNGTSRVQHTEGESVFELRQGADAYKWIACQNLPPFYHPLIRNVTTAAGKTNGMIINYDDQTLVHGKSFVTVSFPGVDKLGSVAAPAPPTPGATPFTVTMKMTNPGVSGSVAYGPGAAFINISVPINMPAAPAGTIKSVAWTIVFEMLFTATYRTWNVMAAGATVMSGPPRVPPSGTFTAQVSTAGYGNVTVSAGAAVSVADVAAGLNFGGITIRVVSCEAVVSGENRTTTTPVPQTPEAISAPSAAEAIWGTVSADIVDGIRDDGDGTITGIKDASITNPSDVTKLILIGAYPNTEPSDIGSTFDDTRERLRVDGILWAGMIDCSIPFSQLRRKLGEQSRCALHLGGGQWEFAYLELAPAATLTLDKLHDLRDLEIKRTLRTDLVNSLRVMYKPDFRKTGEDIFRKITIVEDLTQPGLEERVQRDLRLDLIQNETVALILANFWLSMWKRPRVLLTLTTWWNAIGYNKYSVLSVTSEPLLDELGSLVFRITGIRFQIEKENAGRVALSLTEANP